TGFDNKRLLVLADPDTFHVLPRFGLFLFRNHGTGCCDRTEHHEQRHDDSHEDSSAQPRRVVLTSSLVVCFSRLANHPRLERPPAASWFGKLEAGGPRWRACPTTIPTRSTAFALRAAVQPIPCALTRVEVPRTLPCPS